MSQVQNGAALPHGYVLNGEKQSYVIEKAIGQGAFGITYLAKYKAQIQGQMGRGSAWVQVAVKEFFMREFNRRDEQTLSLNESSDASIVDKYRRAFMREARNLAKMQHDNIVNVFEVIETNNTAYIVMEFLDGGNLDEYIVGKGRLSEDEALRLFEPVCDAVCYMHAKKMLHLDVKPKNIMLDEEGHVYLIDFGLSKQYASNGEPESSTSIGLGTPGYAPSEQADQADGSKDFQRTLDIYALGATMYKMLTGQTPPKATEVTASMLDGSDMIKSDLRSIGVSPSVASVVSKAMYPSRKKRYQTVEELMGAFGWKPNKYAFEEPETPIADGQSAIGSKEDAEEETVAAGSDITVPTPSGKKSGWLKWFLIGLAAVVVLSLLARGCGSDNQAPEPIPVEETVYSLANTSDNFTNPQSQSVQAQSASAAQRPATDQPATQPVEPKTGSLKLTSTPSGASIWIDGKNTGKKTPDIIEDLTAGSHKVVLKSSGYEDLSQSITISAGRRADKDLQLKKRELSQTEPTYTPSEMNKIGNDYYYGRNGKQKDYSQAVSWYLKSAEQGNASAQCFLGYCYETGQGVTQDYSQAVAWYRKAAEQGDASAQCNLGLCYETGQGVTQDYSQAVAWYRKSAEQGNANAQGCLGYCYETGQGVTQDYSQAASWYRKSAEQGNAIAQCCLGNCYHNGNGVSQDYTQAVAWYRKSAEQGNANAQCCLGYCYETGQGVTQDYSQAASWYRKSAEQGNARAQYNLGLCYEYAKGVGKDMEVAGSWYSKAAKQGDKNAIAACKRLGIFY